MGTLNIVLTAVLVISAVMSSILVLMHSGKGGLSEASVSTFASNAGTAIVERNLDRLTAVMVAVFLVDSLAMAITYPLAVL